MSTYRKLFKSHKNQFLSILLFASFSVLYLIIAYPALHGTLELDDYAHLKELAKINTFEQFIDYTFFQFSSSGQRFLSLFSFALQSGSWPVPFNFKLVNLLIHLGNAFIIYWICFQLFALKLNKQQSLLAAAIALGLWLFAPIHIFSVFYTIQRMNLLATFFTLLGCASFIYFRQKVKKESYSLKYYLSLSFFVVLFLGTGIASKENGILLCVYLIIIETAFFSSKTNNNYWKMWTFLFLWLPLIAVFIYLLASNRLNYSSVSFYPFSSGERIINQTVILLEYLVKIILPSYGSYGLINDDIEIYRSWLNGPVLFSTIIIVCLLMSSYTMRKKSPVLFFGLFWFFGGHLLESTAIRLELYFDHRNYLPSLGIYFILAYYLLLAWQKLNTFFLKFLVGICLILYILLSLNVLYKTVYAFSSEKNLAIYQLKFHPDSKRAQLQMINYLLKSKQYKASAFVLSNSIQANPENITLRLYQIYASNLHPTFKTPDLPEYLSAIKQGKNDRAIDAMIYAIFDCLRENKCHNISFGDFRSIIDSLLVNPSITQKNLAELYTVLKAKSYQNENNWSNALQTLQGYESKNNIKNIDFYFLILQSQYMLGYYDEAWLTITTIENRLENNPIKKLAVEDYIKLFKTHMHNNELKSSIKIQDSNNVQK